MPLNELATAEISNVIPSSDDVHAIDFDGAGSTIGNGNLTNEPEIDGVVLIAESTGSIQLVATPNAGLELGKDCLAAVYVGGG